MLAFLANIVRFLYVPICSQICRASLVNTPASWSAHALKTKLGMPSGPATLRGLIRLNVLLTSTTKNESPQSVHGRVLRRWHRRCLDCGNDYRANRPKGHGKMLNHFMFKTCCNSNLSTIHFQLMGHYNHIGVKLVLHSHLQGQQK